MTNTHVLTIAQQGKVDEAAWKKSVAAEPKAVVKEEDDFGFFVVNTDRIIN